MSAASRRHIAAHRLTENLPSDTPGKICQIMLDGHVHYACLDGASIQWTTDPRFADLLSPQDQHTVRQAYPSALIVSVTNHTRNMKGRVNVG